MTLAAAAVLTPAAYGASGRPEAQQSALHWRTCEGAPKVQCATLRVPTDWSKPRGSKISLALTRVRATDRAHKIGTAVFNCGGPGCASAQTLKATPNLF